MADKVYVGVLAIIQPDGKKKPLGLIWEDGRKILIDDVLDVRRAASLKAGGVGDRYACEVSGRVIFLFDEEGRWFVEGRN
jgi:hypothetical protein